MTTAPSHSTRQAYLSCPRKFYLAKTLRLEKDRDPSGLRMGRAFADALDVAADVDPSQSVQAKLDALSLLRQRFTEEITRASAEGRANDIDRLNLEWMQLNVLVPAYLDKYQGRLVAEALAAGHAVVNTEREVAFEDPILGPGRLDAIVEYGSRRIGLEDKLLNPGFWREANERQLRINAQVTAYFAAMRAEGTPIDELRYRVTFKPTIKPNSRTGETLQEYQHRLRDRVRNEPGYAFREYVMHRTDAELDAFVARTQSVGRAMARAKRDLPKYGEAAYPANFGEACTQFGECEYLELCINPNAPGYRIKAVRPRLTRRQEHVLKALGQSFTGMATVTDVHGQLPGNSEQSVRDALNRLVKLELVERVPDKGRVTYTLTKAGRAW